MIAFLTLFLTFILSACTPFGASAVETKFYPGLKLLNPSFLHTWCVPCLTLGTASARFCIHLSELTSIVTTTAHANTNCTDPQYEKNRLDYFSISELNTSVGENAVNIAAQSKGATVTPSSERIAAYFNSLNYCGISSWQVGKPASLANSDCEEERDKIGYESKATVQVIEDILFIKDWTSNSPPTDMNNATRLTKE